MSPTLYRTALLMAACGLCAPVTAVYAAPVAPKPAPKPPAPAVPQPKPAEIKAANVIETGQPIPENAAAGAVVTGEAAKMVAAREQFALEDDIPVPDKRVGVKGESIYPFDRMGVGQSFFVAESDNLKEPWKTLTSMASRQSRDLHPKKFVTAKQTKDGKEGVRIWRAEDATEPLAPPRKKAVKEVVAEPSEHQAVE